MNIFYLSSNPKQAAEMHCDKHVVKMIVETAQLLSTAHRIHDGRLSIGLTSSGRKAKRWVIDDCREEKLYKATHANHPSAVWCRQTVDQYNFTHDLLHWLCIEYTHRYGKTHKVEHSGLLFDLSLVPHNLVAKGWRDPPLAMPDHCKLGSSVESYRCYYINEKKKFAKWTKRPVPTWFQ